MPGRFTSGRPPGGPFGFRSDFNTFPRPNFTSVEAFVQRNSAPGILEDPDFVRLIPYRLELKAKDALLEWLVSVAEKSAA